MGANRIELTGFTDAMRDRLTGLWPVPRDHLVEAAHVRADRTGGIGVLPRCWNDIRSRASSSASGRHDHARICSANWRTVSRARPRRCAASYLSNGRREGRYWLVGDVKNTPGRSMFVRLNGPESGKGAAGKWTDAATGEHGDLLDVIRESCGLADFHDVADEARRFLSLPRPEPILEPGQSAGRHPHPPDRRNRRGGCSPCRSRLRGTLVEAYLRNAALRLCTEPEACVSIRAATIGPIDTRRPRPGRR